VKILVTGGAGYIGSVLTPQLLAQGHEVTVVDSFMYGQSSLLDSCHHRALTIRRGDVRDTALLGELLKSADAVFPLACLTGAPLCEREPLQAKSVNLDAVRWIAEHKSPRQKVIFPTTNSGYGVGQNGVHCTEESPLNPISTYGRLKVEAEKAVLGAGSAISLRLATAFGVSPRMRLDLLVNDFVYRAVTDRFVVLFEAHFKRNYIHVRDVARAFIHGLRNFDRMQGQCYNVGLSDANLSKKELCEVIRRQVPAFTFMEAAVGEDPDKRNYIVSNAKIEATGFKPEVSLEQGIAELIKGYQVVRRQGFSNV
jgi:nucleoside-diphosphate-sugar epimerase